MSDHACPLCGDPEFRCHHDEDVKTNRPTIEWDDNREVATIDGTKWSYEVLRILGQQTDHVGSIFRIVKKEPEHGEIVMEKPGKAELFKWALEHREDGSELDDATMEKLMEWSSALLEKLKGKVASTLKAADRGDGNVVR